MPNLCLLKLDEAVHWLSWIYRCVTVGVPPSQVWNGTLSENKCEYITIYYILRTCIGVYRTFTKPFTLIHNTYMHLYGYYLYIYIAFQGTGRQAM